MVIPFWPESGFFRYRMFFPADFLSRSCLQTLAVPNIQQILRKKREKKNPERGGGTVPMGLYRSAPGTIYLHFQMS